MLSYLHARLRERSTWAAFITAIVSHYALPWPWNLIAIAVAVGGALYPTTPPPTEE